MVSKEINSSFSGTCRGAYSGIYPEGGLKGRDRLDMLVELKVQNCKEKLEDSFDTNKTFLRCTFLKKSVKSFVIFYKLVACEDDLLKKSERKKNIKTAIVTLIIK